MAQEAVTPGASGKQAPLAEGAGAASQATPMIAQYLEIKAANADCLLFYRMGDFYELFFEDAEVASRTLGIALTKRGKHQGEDIPMCGVPVHAADDYLQRLIAGGHRVAVCEQIEDPAEARKRGAKAVVRRDVVRLVTPGTLTEETLLDARAHNFLTALFRGPAKDGGEPGVALASLDISTGELIASSVEATDLAGELARLKPGEVLIGDDLAGEAPLRRLVEEAGAALTPCPRAHFDFAARRACAEEHGLGSRRSTRSASSQSPSLPRSAGCSLMSRSPRSDARRCSVRRARRALARCSLSMPRRAPISSWYARTKAHAPAACSPRSTAP